MKILMTENNTVCKFNWEMEFQFLVAGRKGKGSAWNKASPGIKTNSNGIKPKLICNFKKFP